MASRFMRWREATGYQRRLALSLPDVRRRLEFSTVVSPDLLGLPEECKHLHYVANRLYWARESYFESCVHYRQKIFAWWRTVELFSVRSPDRIKYYCGFPFWWMQYKPPTPLFVSSPFVLTYYSDVDKPGFAVDQTRNWTMALAEFEFLAGAVCVKIAKDRAC